MRASAFVYILRCADDSLYTGWAVDPYKRCRTHNAGAGSRYVRTRLPAVLVYLEPRADKSDALRRERQIKALTRRQKLKLIEDGGCYATGTKKEVTESGK